jgi:putative DNA primase/helicase
MSFDNLVRTLRAKKMGNSWSARCPAHDDRTPSLSLTLRDNRILVHCFAGCSQLQVVRALRDIGIWPVNSGHLQPEPQLTTQRKSIVTHQDADRARKALKVWDEAKPAIGTVVELYLASRGITLPPPASLRHHPSLWHPEGGFWPAMVSLVTDAGGVPRAIQRTYLLQDGRGKAPVEPQRLMLGPCSGSSVRLAEPRDTLLVGEGVETVLSAIQATGLPGWAALSTSGLIALELPSQVQSVTILADADEGGERAAQESALRWAQEGRRVRIARPPSGLDFNDMIQGKTSVVKAMR